ncbi:hypothetical protein C8Q76DRAFT_782827 [Earliella scabrosa]|nr:hypothetical protein C8Q76DRAFT_782827 [Earliella scabrosa]
MSAESLNAQIIADYDSFQVGSYMNVATGALYAFEYVVTFDREVNLFWKRKITMASVLFIANRYLALVTRFMGFPYPIEDQNAPNTSHGLVRSFAILHPWDMSISWKLVLRAALSQNNQETFKMRFIVARSTAMAADLLVLAITWKATFKASREGIRALGGQRTSLSTVLFKNGVIYFMTLLIINILHLSFTLLSIGSSNLVISGNASSMIFFVEPLTAILVSRFLIDLQEANNAMLDQGSLASMGSLAFNRFVGSLGSSLPAPLEDFTSASEPTGIHEDDQHMEEGGDETVDTSHIE